MAEAYGIDLGTTYSAIARMANTGAPEIIEDAETARATLASAVYFEEDGKVRVGESAKEEGAVNPDRLKQFFKRWIGRNDDPDREHYLVDGTEYDPVQLSSMVLGKIVEYSKNSGYDVKDVIITCPAYFNYAQRDATRKAGEVAGLNVMAIINEPTAAAISYCYNRYNEDQTVLVYDLGGGTFDVTLMKMSEKDGNREINVLGTDGDAFRGGCDWDKALYDILTNKYQEQYGIAPDEMPEELKADLRAKVEGVKIKLSNKEETKVKLNADGEQIALEITRAEFEDATRHFVDETIQWLDSVLEKAGCTDEDVDVLLLVGGSTKMPMIKDRLIGRFGDKVIFGDPDKAVAKGAAIMADIRMNAAAEAEKSELFAAMERVYDKNKIAKIVRGNDGEVKGIDDNGNEVALPEEVKKKAEDLMGDEGGEIAPPTPDINPPVHAITITDVAPRTFGIIARERLEDGTYRFIVDNIVHKDERTPCEYNRVYYTPEDNCQRLRFPIVESISDQQSDVVTRDENTREFILDTSLSMISRKALILPVPEGLPKESELQVFFSLDDLGNVYMRATEPKSGSTEELRFSFSEVTEEQMEEYKGIQEKLTYAIDD